MPAPWPDDATPSVIGIAGQGDDDLTWTVPTGALFALESVYAEITMGATSAQPLLTVRDQSGVVIARKRQVEYIDAGTSGSATWALRLADEEATGTQPAIPINVADLGFTGSATAAAAYTHTIEDFDVAAGDGILVWAMAPSLSFLAAPVGWPATCTDSQGNTYSLWFRTFWEHNPPLVNTGAVIALFRCTQLTAPLTAGVDTITVTWTNNVWDRSISAWMIRHVGGAGQLASINDSGDNNMAMYADTDAAINATSYRPDRDNALEFAIVGLVHPSESLSWSTPPGATGFFQYTSRGFSGNKQQYDLFVQTHGADVVIPNSITTPAPEIDVGWLPGRVNIPTFFGPGNRFNPGVNRWKGVVLLGTEPDV